MGVLTITESVVGQLFALVQFAMRPNTAMLSGRRRCGSIGDRQVWQSLCGAGIGSIGGPLLH